MLRVSLKVKARRCQQSLEAAEKIRESAAMALMYGWIPAQIPSNCVCGQSFTVQHALSCPKGGFLSIRHNELRDFTASLLKEVCHGVATEPSLQPASQVKLSKLPLSTNKMVIGWIL